MPQALVNGVRIHYEEAGSGPPVLLIMGLGASLDWWGTLPASLAPRFRVITFDNRGAGRSSHPTGRYSIRQMADDALGLMDAVGMDRAHVLGYSMGGMIAQEIAIANPGRVDRLILAATGPSGLCGTLPRLRAWWLMLSPPRPGRYRDNVLELLFPTEYIRSHPEEVDEAWRMISASPADRPSFMRQLGAILRWSSCGRLSRIAAPTLIVHGGRDILLPVGNAHLLARRIPQSRLELFPEGGHGFGLQGALDFAPFVRAFLDGEST